MKLRRTFFAALRAAHAYPWPVAAASTVVAGIGWLCSRFGWDGPALILAGSALVLALFSNLWWWVRHVMTPGSTKRQLARAAAWAQRSGGVAARVDIAEHASAKTLRELAPVIRPSLAGKRRIPTRELGVELVRLGAGWWGERVYMSSEDSSLRIGSTRSGKTVALACHGLDAPGALITTSTKLDLAEMVHTARKGRAVHILNPAGWRDIPSTVRWSVLTGCTDFGTASRRAHALIPIGPTAEAEQWRQQARRVLALLMHAAAVAGRNMQTVTLWADAPDGQRGDDLRAEVIDALSSVHPGGNARATEMRGFYGLNARTRTSITATMSMATGWLSNDRARDIGDADPETTTLDIHRLILGRETLHLLGHESQEGLAPLIACIVAEIGHVAIQLSATMPNGRIDPPVTMLLDELALVCPIPFVEWTAEMGGRGVTLHGSVQSLSQMRDKWGEHRANAVLGNVTALMVFGGNKAADDLKALSVLTGEHRRQVVKKSGKDDDRETYRWAPVMNEAEISALPPGEVMLLRRGLHVVRGHAPSVLERRRWSRLPLPGDPYTDQALEVADAVADIEGVPA